ncbi:MAG: potassium channel family protein, partial [Pseudomonadota bacterium]|nr:potassium channel family protein [Pseudomonadota bacterium]
MYAFENEPQGAAGFTSYGDALWWTGMIMTTMGSAFWPVTIAGRVLCVLLSLYAFAVFGYVTALLASFFIGRDAQTSELRASEVARLATEIRELRTLLERTAPEAIKSP